MNIKKTKSGVSAAIQITMDRFHKNRTLINSKNNNGFTIKIANTLQEREEVFTLAYKIYLEKDFIAPNAQGWMIQPYDADSETVILIVQDKEKRIIGSVTLVFDECSELPAEKIYSSEINDIQSKGEKVIELSRLVIEPAYRNSKEVLVMLFNYLFIYSYQLKRYSTLIAEVSPRHKNYYKSLLNFKEIGIEKKCPNVRNAPAVLLYLSMVDYQSEIIRLINSSPKETKGRSLYPYFLKQKQEPLVAYYLERQARPISKEEKQYFSISQSDQLIAFAN